MITGEAPEQVLIEGVLLDGADASIPDGLIELWQADAEGRYAHPDDPKGADAERQFSGYGWCHTGTDGEFAFRTIKPGRVPGPDDRSQAPHVLVSIMARGILSRYVTRLYFDDEPTNDGDPVLNLVPPARRDTLVACRSGQGRYRFDIRLQGPRETVFFDI